jgi:hypothetical protein|tara:strand:+ start:30 stop:326 length:297 start_codon:yes stop_codon:yes gene_type:complete
MSISPGSDEERLLLGKWIKMGNNLIVATFPFGESLLDPKVKRDDDSAKRAEVYVKFDHEVAEQLFHLKGKFRYALETYFRDTWGATLPTDEELKELDG